MDAPDTVKTFKAALERQDLATVAAALTEDFVFSGWTRQPLDKNQYLELIKRLKGSIPNLKFFLHNVHVIEQKSDLEHTLVVHANMEVSGTQINSCDLAPFGLPTVPHTHRYICLPDEYIAFALQGDKISSIAVSCPHGGISGLLQQLMSVG